MLKHHDFSKDNLIFEVLGTLDEVSGWLGLVRTISEFSEVLTKIQQDISIFSSFIAGYGQAKAGSKLSWLVQKIRKLETQVKIPKDFILPGKSEIEARLNLARATVRRAERRLVSLSRYQEMPKDMLEYFNKLSWLLFLLARED